LHNEELHKLYASPSIVRVIIYGRMRGAGHVVHLRDMRNIYIILVGKLEGKRPLERPMYRWEDNFKMDLREVEGMD
jgi:hypothetical protein